jgi:general secretion pathway protein E
VVNEDVRAEVLRGRGASVLRQLSIASGMRPLRVDGWRQVAAGVTTPEEVLRVAR